MAAKHGKHKTVAAGHGHHGGIHGKFSKGGAMKVSGHHGLIGEGKGKGMKAHPGVHGPKSGHIMVSASNVGKLGHK